MPLNTGTKNNGEARDTERRFRIKCSTPHIIDNMYITRHEGKTYSEWSSRSPACVQSDLGKVMYIVRFPELSARDKVKETCCGSGSRHRKRGRAILSHFVGHHGGCRVHIFGTG
ncbi:hypothetical protein BDN72DRAFT_117434 [Pluteus cervinus]|uniref:Uncharacterized protein n=1 Tax=Pluteus cervinus TaxID=181527 RepID=A0ACD3BAC7_9AGAR|nr:hypothetical protein BDN72DRAFT_117434 [Pluteus cervinus]